MKKFILILMIICLFSVVNAQDRTNKIAFLIVGDPFNPPADLGLTFRIDNNISIEPIIGFTSINHDEIPSQSNFRFGLGIKKHMNTNKVDPYFGLRLGTNVIFTKEKNYTDFIFGAVGGAEYFLSKWFSAGWEFQFNFAKTDDEFSPSDMIPSSKLFYTSQFLMLRLYIN